MLSLGVDIQKFQICAGAAEFDCLFSTRNTPLILALTSRGLNPRFFKFEVRGESYWIDEYFGDQYGTLVEVLRRDGRSREKLIPRNFLTQIDVVIPRQATAQYIPAEEIIRLRPDLEEPNRPYFDTWIYWGLNKSPSRENAYKTLVALGRKAMEHSKRMNASSKWSAHPTGRVWHDEI